MEIIEKNDIIEYSIWLIEGFLQLIGYIEKKDRFAFIFKGYDVNK